MVISDQFLRVGFNMRQDINTQNSIPVRLWLQIVHRSLQQIVLRKLSEKAGAKNRVRLNRSQLFDRSQSPQFGSDLANTGPNLEHVAAQLGSKVAQQGCTIIPRLIQRGEFKFSRLANSLGMVVI